VSKKPQLLSCPLLNSPNPTAFTKNSILPIKPTTLTPLIKNINNSIAKIGIETSKRHKQ
jgi:hypothetical protein